MQYRDQQGTVEDASFAPLTVNPLIYLFPDQRLKFCCRMVNAVQKLYAIERKIKDKVLSKQAALQLRQEQAVPILQTLKEWMTAEYVKVVPKSAIGQAIGYCLRRWGKLSVYTTNASVNIDNNPVEIPSVQLQSDM